MKKIIVVFILVATLLIMSIGKGSAQQNNLPNNGPDALANENLISYTIGSGDLLEIITWNEPQLSRSKVLVRTDGKISFPFLDDLHASGLTLLELKQKIEDGLKKYVEHPYVTVDVEDPQSKKFYVLGEVVNTGEYPLIKNLTVLQAFAIAGGFTEWASKRQIILLRHEGTEEKIYRVNYRRIIDGKDLDQNLMLKPNDTIIVP
ncbi:MAG: polysaccharide biosynthesis/export family protein [Thermoplasmata archaeon]